MNSTPVYAVNLLNVKDKEEYLTYLKRSSKEVAARGGKVIAIGKYREDESGDITPREVFLLVEWGSHEALKKYREDTDLAELHSYRNKGTSDYILHVFDKLEDFRPILKSK
ncbi:MAG: DUF1330 domain-containing protein [Firmicutes bacterium HGW-Firmicutes-12]|jgi:uncharacterized protein (DUF1330 family)|nr:MAG: DUF1330 domain-containing protein [Firmicutes bacterium HGW-Firmicutes-12]